MRVEDAVGIWFCANAPDDETARGIIDKLFFSDKRYDLGEVGRYKINRKLGLDYPLQKKVLTKQDIIEIIKYLVRLTNGFIVIWIWGLLKN